MRYRLKKAISAILAAALVFTALPKTTYADEYVPIAEPEVIVDDAAKTEPAAAIDNELLIEEKSESVTESDNTPCEETKSVFSDSLPSDDKASEDKSWRYGYDMSSESELEATEFVDSINHASSYSGTLDRASSATTIYRPDLNSLPNLRSQNPYGTCWAHATMALAEINMMKKGIMDPPDYSELQTAYFAYNFVTDPLGGTAGDSMELVGGSVDFLDYGGTIGRAARNLACYIGATAESDVPYFSADKVRLDGLDDKYAYGYNEAHLKNIYRVNPNDTEAIKKLIRTYGAVGISYLDDDTYYNEEYNTYYNHTENKGTGHSVVIVGWDDSLEKSKFGKTEKPSDNGAWLVRNSWTTNKNEQSHDGYFWLSYYDYSLATRGTAYALEFSEVDDYNHNYQYDGCGEDMNYGLGSEVLYAANVFTADPAGDEYLRAVSFDTGKYTDVTYSVDIYTGVTGTDSPKAGKLIEDAHVTGKTTYAGYYTVPIGEPVKLTPGEKFSVIVTLTKKGQNIQCGMEHSGSSEHFRAISAALPGQSFLSDEGVVWEDVGRSMHANIRIKAFTDDVKKVNPYKLTFDPNSGDELPEKQRSKNVYNGFNYGGMPIPEKTGYTFTGWFTLPDAGVQIKPETGVDLTEDQTLYAHWTANKYTIKFDSNKAYEGETRNSVASMSMVYDVPKALNENLYLRKGCSPRKIKCWNTKKDGSGIYFDDKEVVSNLTPNPGETVVLYAQWDPNTYTLFFDAMGGTSPEESRSIVYGDMYGTLPVPVKPGYTFKGWCSNSTGIGVVNEEKDQFLKDSNTTLFAKWEANKYSVKFEANGGTGTMREQAFTYDAAPNTLISCMFTREGYLFANWNTKADGTGISYSEEHLVRNLTTVPKGIYTLYAQWKPITYSIRFDKNDDKAEGKMLDIPVVTYDKDFTLPANKFSKTGYHFSNWDTKDDYTGESFSDGATIKNLASKQDAVAMLYAKWEPNEYDLTFDLNAPDADPLEISSTVKVTFDKTYSSAVIGNALPTPTRPNYTFMGWYTTARDNASTQLIDNDTVYTIPANQTIYAHWKGVPVSVTFNPGTGAQVSETDRTVYYMETLGEEKSLPRPTKPGYTFTGWHYNNGIEDVVVNDTFVVNTTSAMTLNASWKANAYTIAFNANGGRGTMDSIKATYDVKVAISANTFTRTGYTFAYWTLDNPETGTKYNDAAEVINLTTNPNGTATLYAVWAPNEYRVELDVNDEDALLPEGAPANIRVKFNSKYGYSADLSGDLPVPVKDKYFFAGWRTMADGGDLISKDSVVTIPNNHTLYAWWRGQKSTISFDGNGGTVDFASMDVYYNEPAGTLPGGQKEGYTLAYWGYRSDDGSESRISSESIIDFTENRTYMAYWKPNNYTIAFNANGADGGSMDRQNAVYDQDIILAGNEFVREGYDFIGWSTQDDGKGTIYTNREKVRNLTATADATVTLYALWRAKTPPTPVPTGGPTGTPTGIPTGIPTLIPTPTPEPDDPNEKPTRGDVSTTDLKELLGGGYTGKESDFAKIPRGLWALGIPNEEKDCPDYTGSEITFDNIRVYNGNVRLTENVDYEITYRNNIRAKDATAPSAPAVIITGLGSYTGKIRRNFTIKPRDLGSITLNLNKTVSGKNSPNVFVPDITCKVLRNNRVQKGTSTVIYTLMGREIVLKEGTDFTYLYPGTVKGPDYDSVWFGIPGSYPVLIVGKGNYSGCAFFTQHIVEEPKLIGKSYFAKIKTVTANGHELKPEVVINAKKGGPLLMENKDYILKYYSNILPGTGTVIVTGIGEYTGTKKLSFKINARNMKTEVSISGLPIYEYTGQELCPKNFVVRYIPAKGAVEPLVEGTDYILTYKNNKNAGKGQVVLKGIGPYKGTLKKNFTIYPHEIEYSEITMNAENIIYRKKGARPEISLSYNGSPLIEGKDYVVRLKDNKKVTKEAYVTIEGRGNFKTTIPFTKAFEIGKNSEGTGVTVTATDIIYKQKPGLCKPTIVVKDDDGNKLIADKDYIKMPRFTYYSGVASEYIGTDVLDIDLVPAGAEIRVTLTGINNYEGATFETTFRYVTTGISKAKVKIAPRAYTGKQIKPGKSYITVIVDGQELTKDDYDIIGYGTNTRVGTGKVYLKGKGNYGGIVTATFKIKKQSFGQDVLIVEK